MKLKRQRQDVKIMREQWASIGASPVMVDIARRYHRLILMAESELTAINALDDSYRRSVRELHVMEDSEVKK